MSLSTLFLRSQKSLCLIADGISMFPLLRPKDILYFKKVPFHTIRNNDLIVVRKKNTFAHKVVYIHKNYLITKGTNNAFFDGKIYSKQIIGRVYQVKRGKDFIDLENIYLIQSTQYFQEIVKMKRVFEKEKINFVFLKGLPLHLFYEKSHPRRIYADCDVLIDKKHYKRSERVFEKFNYQKKEFFYSKFYKLLKDKLTEISYIKHINGFPIVFDMHLEAGFLMNQLGKLDALYSQSLINKMTEQFLKEKRLVNIQNTLFPVLSPPNLIIYLSLHFFHHNFRGWYMLEFLNKIMKRYRENGGILKEVRDKTCLYQLQGFIYPVFLLLEKYYGLQLPKDFLEAIKPGGSKMRYIKNNVLSVNIFNNETKVMAGMKRFKNLFFLSPHPLIKRFLIIFNPQVIYSFVWVTIFFVRRSFIRAFKSSWALLFLIL